MSTASLPLQSPHRFCVAPMIDWTDRFCRFFHRQLSAHARLYTEMVVDQAILHGDRDHLLKIDPAEQPVALQLGGSDPALLAEAARIGAGYGYNEINLNVGCPSDRVQSGTFGACLMRTPEVVARAVAAMAKAVEVPVTVKCRIGVDDQDPAQELPDFLRQVEAAGARTVIIHARKAWLQGLSPKENRTIPPLDYPLVAQMAAAFPELEIILNGGIADLKAAQTHLEAFPGVMLGRAAYERPWILAHVDQAMFGAASQKRSRASVVAATANHFAGQDVRVWRYARHMLGLFHGSPGARTWRRALSEKARQAEATPAWLVELAEEIDQYAEQSAAQEENA